MNIGDILHGFRITGKSDIEDCSAVLYVMEHEKTGAGAVWLDREDDNMTFAVCFKTTPEDDTGVFHILEHSVLNGSEKYPVREPFVELLKSSMQTFLNAMTYPDKTVYPVSSRNRKDFLNLISVYLDAVFKPRIYTEPNIFRQEGWHYEIRDPEDMPAYKGVVHSEMQGAFSSVDTILVNELNRLLFPDNCYRFVSGGDPEKITDLTYEDFLKTHAEYYHPSNAKVFLDGSADVDAVLELADSYFSQYEKIDASHPIPTHDNVLSCTRVIPYEIAPGEDPAGRTHAAAARIISRYDDVIQNYAWQVLSQILVGTNESPFKKAVIGSGLGQDVELELYDGIAQPWAVLAVRNTDEDKAEAAFEAVRKTAEDIVNSGLDHDEILACLNQMQFQYLEPKEPAGIMYMSAVYTSWLYGGEPGLYLNCGYVFDELRERLKTGYFEQLVKEFLLDTEHQVRVVAVPDPGLAAKRAQKEQAKLEAAYSSWDSGMKQRLVQENLALDEWQANGDSPEAKDTLPKLKLEDIDRFPVDIAPAVRDCHGACILEYPKEKSGIVYLNMYFSLAGIRLADIPKVSLFVGLMRELRTEHFSVQQLQSEIRRDLGLLYFGIDAYRSPDDISSCTPVLTVSCSVLEKNLERAKELISEILLRTVYEKETVLPLLKQEQEAIRQAAITAGHAYAGLRAAAHITSDAAAREAMSGFTYSRYINRLAENYETSWEELFDDFELFREVLFARSRLTLSCTGPENRKAVESFVMEFPFTDATRCLVHFPRLETGNEAIVIPSQVSYTAYASCLQKGGAGYSGVCRAAAQILTYSYLWNEIRVKGGAYGTSFSPALSGLVSCMSYRDPHPEQSAEVFRGCGKFLKLFAENTDDLSSNIIGAINSMDPLIPPGSRIRLNDVRYFTGLKPEDSDRLRKELLHTTAEDLEKTGDILDKALAEGFFCIVGPKEAVDKCSEENLTVYEF